MDKNIVYIGDSWAARSFDTHDGSESDFTNLQKELNLNVKNMSKSGTSNLENITRLTDHNIDGIIWVYTEPLRDIETGIINITGKDYLLSENCEEIRQELDNKVIDELYQKFKCPIALIGGLSDVQTNIKYDNMTVIHNSWQKFLSNLIDVDLNYGWGASDVYDIR